MQKKNKKKTKKVKPKDLTESQILKLRPRFKFGNEGMTMIDWFQVTKGAGFYTLRSGLRHADGVTKSPFYYEYSLGGENTKKRVLEHFNKWWRKAKKKDER